MKITIVGDIMCEPPILEGAKQTDGSYDFAPMYEKMLPMFREADYVIGNMETTLAGENWNTPRHSSLSMHRIPLARL